MKSDPCLTIQCFDLVKPLLKDSNGHVRDSAFLALAEIEKFDPTLTYK